MDITNNQTTLVAVGHSNLSDAFQCGREAAQMAKNQMSGVSPDLVIAFGPAGPHFQDFIEGVRLITGEYALIGLPSHQLLTNDLFLSEGQLVILFRSDSIYFTLASTVFDPQKMSAALNAVISDHRRQRGNIFQQFQYHGLFLVDNVAPMDKNNLMQEATVETGLDSWIVSLTPTPNLSLPLICRDVIQTNGLIGLECLSNDPIGMGAVSIGSFQHNPPLFIEALRSAYRQAIEHMIAPPVASLVLFDFHIPEEISNELIAFIKREDSPFSSVPIIGMSTASQAIKYRDRSGAVQKETIVVILIPS